MVVRRGTAHVVAAQTVVVAVSAQIAAQSSHKKSSVFAVSHV
jgi:hypothetical protein